MRTGMKIRKNSVKTWLITRMRSAVLLGFTGATSTHGKFSDAVDDNLAEADVGLAAVFLGRVDRPAEMHLDPAEPGEVFGVSAADRNHPGAGRSGEQADARFHLPLLLRVQ